MDDEKYFTLSGNVPGNSRYYLSDLLSAPTSVKFQQKQKYEANLLVWLAISSRGISSPYIHRSMIAVREEMYLKQCTGARLLPFINKYYQNDKILSWPDFALSHYASSVMHCLRANNVSFVCRNQNPPNILQYCPIEKIWALIKRTAY